MVASTIRHSSFAIMLPTYKSEKTPPAQDNEPAPASNYPVFYGSTTAIICIIYLYSLYLSAPTSLVSGYAALIWLFLLLMMGAVAVGVRAQQSGGFIHFKDLLSATYKAFAIAYTLQYIFVYSLFRFIDPSLIELSKEAGRKILIQQRDPNWTDEMLQQQIQAFNENNNQIFDFLGLAIHLVMGFLLALFVSFLFKREQPDY